MKYAQWKQSPCINNDPINLQEENPRRSVVDRRRKEIRCRTFLAAHASTHSSQDMKLLIAARGRDKDGVGFRHYM